MDNFINFSINSENCSTLYLDNKISGGFLTSDSFGIFNLFWIDFLISSSSLIINFEKINFSFFLKLI